MFHDLTMPPPDKILSLMPIFRNDRRGHKIDLGVGVYRDPSGATPILKCVEEAERRILDAQTTKAYVGPAGDPIYCALMTQLVFGDAAPRDRLCAIQTPGAAGALAILAGLIAMARPGSTIHVPNPTWINHFPILESVGLEVVTYPYFDSSTGLVDFNAAMQYLSAAPRGDVILLHGCCHNPTGADLDLAQWRKMSDIIEGRGLIPFVDIAYQGFGDGLEDDAFAVRLLASMVPEMIVASSCSKNFGIYRERTGTAFVLGSNPQQAEIARAQMVTLARDNYSMPPDHGSAIVRTILEDPTLAAGWRQELEEMRVNIRNIRDQLSAAFRRSTGDDRFAYFRTNKGMFSRLNITPQDAARLREEFAIYVIEDGRINVAGLQIDQIGRFVEAITAIDRG